MAWIKISAIFSWIAYLFPDFATKVLGPWCHWPTAKVGIRLIEIQGRGGQLCPRNIGVRIQHPAQLPSRATRYVISSSDITYLEGHARSLGRRVGGREYGQS